MRSSGTLFIEFFRFEALKAIIVSKAMSIVVVAFAPPFRAAEVMALGAIAGAYLVDQLLGIVPSATLIPMLVII